MIKLKYKSINFNGLNILYAKYRKNRNLIIKVDSSGIVKLTCPYYASDEEIIRFIEEKESWIRNSLNKVASKTNLANMPALKREQKKQLQIKIQYYIDKYEFLLNTKVNKFALRKMKTLWGSCTWQDKTIRFNSLLYYMSDSFIEYIVLHEMAHFFVHNHSKEFYNIITKYMPNYKTIWKEFKKFNI